MLQRRRMPSMPATVGAVTFVATISASILSFKISCAGSMLSCACRQTLQMHCRVHAETTKNTI
jgi:hypothetical protein